MYFRRWSLSLKLVVTVGAGFFALFVVLALISLRAVDEATNRILEERRALTVEAALDIDAFLEQAFFELEKATTFAPFDSTAPDLGAETHLLAHAYGRIGSFSLGVSFLDATGHVVLTQPDDPNLIGRDLSQMPHIAAALSTGKRTVSAPHIEQRTGRPTVALTIPILNAQGQVIGLLSGLIETMNSPISRTIEVARRLGTTGHAEVFDHNLVVVASTEPGEVLRHAEHSEFYHRQFDEGSGPVVDRAAYDEEGHEGDYHIMAFAPVRLADWGVAIGGDEAETFAPMYQLRTGLLLLGWLSMVVLLALTLYATRRLLRPLGSLTAAAERITAGDLSSPIALRASSEIAVLASSLETMRDKLASSLSQIRGWNRELEDRVVERTAELERRNRELAISASIAATVTTSLDLDEVLQRALDVIVESVGLEMGAIRLASPDSDELVLRVYRGLSDEYVREMGRVTMSQCQCGRICDTLSPAVFIREHGAIEGETDDCPVFGVACKAIVPLQSKSHCHGLLYLGSNDCGVFREVLGSDAVRLLTFIGHQLGVAIEHATLYEELQRREVHRRHLLEKVIEAQENERKRIARELHDETGQALTALIMNLEAIDHALPTGHSDIRTRVERMESIATQAIEEIRTIILDLRPTALDDLGLVPAIRRYAERHLGDQGVVTEIEAANLHERLAPHLETVLFRVVQEAINNVSRHSSATMVSVKLGQSGDRVIVEVSDNGRGFDRSDLPQYNDNGLRGMGLVGIEERAALMGGTSRITTNLGHGTCVRVELPILRPEVKA